MLVELQMKSEVTAWIRPKAVDCIMEATTENTCLVYCRWHEKGKFMHVLGTAAEVAAKLNAAEEKSNGG